MITAGPATCMAAPDPSRSPVPMEPPTATMAICRAESSFLRPFSCSDIGESYIRSPVIAVIARHYRHTENQLPDYQITFLRSSWVSTFRFPAYNDDSTIEPPCNSAYNGAYLQASVVRPFPAGASEEADSMADISKRLDKAEKYLQRSKPEAALEEYLSILDDEPKNLQVRQAAADLCLALDRRQEAADLLSSLFEQEFEEGESAKGSITYKKLAKVATPTPIQVFHYAQLIEKRDKNEALEAYQSALEGFERQKKDKQALAACKRIVELSPTIENLQLAAEKAALLGEET